MIISNNLSYVLITTLAMQIVKKWRVACEQIGPAWEALAKLTETTDTDDLATWKSMAEKATQERRTNVEAMDIYEVQSQKCESY